MNDLSLSERLLRPRSRVVQRCGGWQGSAATCPCHVYRQPNREGTEPGPVPSMVATVLRGGGSALDEGTRQEMQLRLGHDFGRVRIHSDERAAASAREVDAVAYTAGQHVVIDGDRMPAAPSDRARVIAHELVHTLQDHGGGDGQAPTRLGHPQSAEELQAHQAAGAAVTDRAVPGVARAPSTAKGTIFRQPAVAPPAVQPQPRADPDWGLGLTFRDDGRLDVIVSGPKLPAAGNPAFGLRRQHDGSYRLSGGGIDRVLTPDEVPAMLRGILHRAAAGGPRTAEVQVPTCTQLHTIDGRRMYTFDEYRAKQTLNPRLMPLTAPLFALLASVCERPVPEPLDPSQLRAGTQPHEAVPPVVPAGEAVG